MENWFMPERVAAIRRAIASEIMLCAPAAIAMLATFALSDLGTPTAPMKTEPLSLIELPERHISGTLS